VFSLEFAALLDVERLNRALRLLVQAEPVLGCRLVISTNSALWQPLEALPETLLKVTSDGEEYERLSTESPDAAVGPQISALLWRRPNSDILVLKISHASGDASGAIYCFERLAEIYSKLSEDAAYVPPIGTGRRDMEQVRAQIPKRAYFGFVRDWLTLLVGATRPWKTQEIGLAITANDPWRFVTRQLPAERVTALSQYGKARDATLNDLVLAAYYRAIAGLGQWDGNAALRAVCTVDLRRYLPDARPNAIANLSAAEFPFLGRELGKDFEDTLRRVATAMNKRKRRNPGLAVSYLTPKVGRGLTRMRLLRTQKAIGDAPLPTLTNVGRLSGERLSFAGQVPVDAHFLCFKVNLPHLVVGLSGYNGALTLSNAASDSARPQLEALLDRMLAELPV